MSDSFFYKAQVFGKKRVQNSVQYYSTSKIILEKVKNQLKKRMRILLSAWVDLFLDFGTEFSFEFSVG